MKYDAGLNAHLKRQMGRFEGRAAQINVTYIIPLAVTCSLPQTVYLHLKVWHLQDMSGCLMSHVKRDIGWHDFASQRHCFSKGPSCPVEATHMRA